MSEQTAPEKEHRCEGMPEGARVEWNKYGPRWDVFDLPGDREDGCDDYYSGITHCPWCPVKLDASDAYIPPPAKEGERDRSDHI